MKRIWLVLLALLLLAVPAGVQGQFSYSTNADNTLTITGYSGLCDVVSIPSTLDGLPVNSIGENAFNGSGLTSITIPSSITNIGNYAFLDCSNLTNVTMSNGIGPASIGDFAFFLCSNLTSVTFPSSVTSLGEGSFAFCASLASVYFQGNAPAVGSLNFAADPNVTVYYLPGTTGWSNTFAGLPTEPWWQAIFSFTTNADNTLTITGYTGPGGVVIIPTNINGLTVTMIGGGAFQDDTDLTSVAIPTTVTTIRFDAFIDCTGLTNGTLGNGVTTIEAAAFLNCSALGSITIPASVTSIGDDSFFACGSLTNVYFAGNAPCVISDSFDSSVTAYYLPCASGWGSVFGGGLPTVPWWQLLLSYITNAGTITITGCSNLCATTVVVLPASMNGLPVTSIGTNAFEDFSNLISLTLPASITNIGADAFEGCSSLTSVNFSGNAPAGPANVFNGDTNASVYFLAGTTGWGATFGGLQTAPAPPPNQFSFTSDGVAVTITSYTGPDAGSVLIPEFINGLPVTTIGANAFSGFSNLTSITIPYGVTTIENGAFYGCASLTGITIPLSVTSIGQTATYGGTAFGECTGLTNITIPGSVTSVAYGSFFGCSSLTNVTFLNGVASIGNGVFVYCSNLVSVTIPASVDSIGVFAFELCPSLATFTVDANNSDFTSENGVLFTKSQTALVEYPPGLRGPYSIPGSVTIIGDYAFYECSNLTSVTIPAGVTRIGLSAFYGCAGLASVLFAGNPPAVPDPTDIFDFPSFNGDTNTTAYYLPDASGWSSNSVGLPAVLWNPLIQTSVPSFGISNNQFGFNVSGTANIPIVVEACTNLASPVWTPLTNVLLTNGSFYFSDPQWTNYPGRFYGIGFP